MKPLAAVAALATAVVAFGVPSLFRPGYSPDEEFTLFAVRGIAAHGLPLLPSGLLYDRGLLYSYLSWLAATLTGFELPAFRALSLGCAAASIVLGYGLVRRVASPRAGILAAALVATSVPFWAVATTGRFYAAFLLAYLTVLAVGTSDDGRRTRLLGVFAATFLARLTHELAFTTMAVPALGAALAWLGPGATNQRGAGEGGGEPGVRGPDVEAVAVTGRSARDWLVAGIVMAAGLAAAQGLLTGLHFMAADRGETMIQRFFVWQVLNLFERPQGAPLGVVLAGLVVAWLVAPTRARPAALVAAGCAAAVLCVALLGAARANTLSPEAAGHLVARGLHYPLDMFWHLARAYPVMLWMGLALLMVRLSGMGGAWPAGQRAAHLGWVGWVLWFGVIDSGITTNYLLLPTVFLLAALAIDWGQVVNVNRGQVVNVTALAAAAVVTISQWSGPGPPHQALATARPTITVPGIEDIRRSLGPADRIACTDELACVLLVGRADAWLALDDYVRERFLVRQGADLVGVYTGVDAAFRPADLLDHRAGLGSAGRVIVVDVFKAYAIGPSADWLPRALESDGLAFRTLLATPQARVVQLLPPAGR